MIRVKENARYKVRAHPANNVAVALLKEPGFTGYTPGRVVTVQNVGLSHIWFAFQDGAKHALYKSEFAALFEEAAETPEPPKRRLK